MQPVTVVLLVGAAAAAAGSAVVPPWLDVYSGPHQTGSTTTFYDSQSSLGGWNDAISSVCISGFWVFFEHEQYNEQGGGVLWAYGINGGCFTIDSSFDKQVSSIRRVGDYNDASLDSLSLYDGTYYTGEQLFTEHDMASIASAHSYQSVIVSGPDTWTIYNGDNYTGQSACLYSGSDSASVNDQTIEYGLFPSAYYLGVVGGNIHSVRKGCFSSVHLRGEPLSAANRLSNFVDKDTANEVVGNAGTN